MNQGARPEGSSLQRSRRRNTYSSRANPPDSPPPSPPESPKPEIEEGELISLAALCADPSLRAQFNNFTTQFPSSDSEDDADEPEGKGKDDDKLPVQDEPEAEPQKERKRDIAKTSKKPKVKNHKVSEDDANKPEGKGKDDDDEPEGMLRLLA